MINVTIWASVYGAFEKDPEKVSLNNGKLLNGLDTIGYRCKQFAKRTESFTPG